MEGGGGVEREGALLTITQPSETVWGMRYKLLGNRHDSMHPPVHGIGG